MGVALVLFFLSDKLIKQEWFARMIPDNILDSSDAMLKSDTLAVQFVGRMSFILLLFHTLIFLITLARNEMAAQVHDGCWAVKAILVAGGYIASWWIPTAFFDDFYLPAAKYLSAVFLLYQVLLMLNAAYKVNDNLVNNMVNDQSKCSSAILIAVTLSLFAADIAWTITSFSAFTCSAAIAWQCITLAAIVVMFVLKFVRAREDASILTNALAGLYCLYLQWSALSSNPDRSCNKNHGSRSNAVLQIILGMVVTMFALFMMSGTQPTGDEPDQQ